MVDPTNPGQLPPTELWGRVSATVVNGELHVCGLQLDGEIYHSSRINPPAEQAQNTHDFRTWVNLENSAGERGRFTAVACVGVAGPSGGPEDLHVVGLTDDGRLWHTVGSNWTLDGREDQFATWTSFADIGALIGAPSEGFSEIDAARMASGLAVVGITRETDEKLLLSVHNPSKGSWSPARNLIAGAPTNTQQPLSLMMVAIAPCEHDVPEGRYHLAIAVSSGGWTPAVASEIDGRPRAYTRTMFTMIAPGPEDWDGQPATEQTSMRPWEDVDVEAAAAGSNPAPGYISAITITERPIDDTLPP